MKHALKLLLTLWIFLGIPVLAQTPPVDQGLARPPGLEPVPDGPPDAPHGSLTDAAKTASGNDPDITIRQDGPNKVEEYRVHGKLYAIRVTPPIGPAYTMVDRDGTGNFVPDADPAGQSVHPPQWTLFEW